MLCTLAVQTMFSWNTSFSGRVLFCFNRKSKSWPSMNSSTVQNLHQRKCHARLHIAISRLTSWSLFQRHQIVVQHAARRERGGATSHITKYSGIIINLQCDQAFCGCCTLSTHVCKKQGLCVTINVW